MDTERPRSAPSGYLALAIGVLAILAVIALVVLTILREEPLLLVLDEPTAALDAETEHALFERYAAAAREHVAAGRITVLVSHRFSTVRMADLIVVLDGAKLVDVGPHEALLARGGLYAELYRLQAAAYR